MGGAGLGGKTTITGNYTQSGTGTLALDISGTNRGGAFTNGAGYYDYLSITGTASLGGAVAVTMNNYDSSTNAAAIFTNATFVGNTGSFSSASLNYSNAVAGVYGTSTNGIFTNYSFLNTNGLSTYQLKTTGTNVTFGYYTATNNWIGGTNWGSGQGNPWNGSYSPNSTYALAYFGTNTGGALSVTNDANVIVGGMIFSNSTGYNITGNGSSTLTLDGSSFGNTATIQNQLGNQTINVPLQLNTLLLITNTSGSSTVTLGGSVSGAGSINATNGTLGLNTSSNQTIAVGISGNGALVKSGAGTSTLTAANSYNGSTLISAGTLQIGNGTDAGSITSSTITNNGGLSYNVGTGNRTNSATISGSGSLTQAGTGTLTITGNNSYTGGTVISSGQITAGSTTALGAATNTLNNSGKLDLNGNALTVGSLTGNGVITNGNATGATFNLGGNNASTTYSGRIVSGTGSIGLTKSGTGTTTLTGNNTFTGTTTVSGGGLDLSGGGQLSATTNVVVNAGSTLLLGNTGAANVVKTTSAVTLAGGTLSMGGSSGGSVKTSVQAFGALTLTANSFIDFSTLSGNSSLTFASIGGLSANTLFVYNYSSTPGSATTLNDSFSLTSSELANISFFTGAGSGFMGTGGFSGNEIVPVPEPGVMVAAALLLGVLTFSSRHQLARMMGRKASLNLIP